jgi:hypothetical protein
MALAGFMPAGPRFGMRGLIMKHRIIATLLGCLLIGATAAAETTYQPFILASVSDSELTEQTAATVAALERSGFSVAGTHSPVEGANVIVVTSPELRAAAAQTPRGGYGAAQRISVTEREGKTEVAFVNPVYIQHAYRLEGDLQPVYEALKSALGEVEAFGAKKKMTAKKLKKYHYMVGMQRFDDPSELGSFESYDAAVAAVQKGLEVSGDPLSLVYRIDLSGKQQTVFGVAMRATGAAEEEVDIDAAHQLAIVNFEGYSKAAYFPYEVLVSGANVEALHMRFRMAVHFPDLPMMGKHGFMKLMASPKATEEALRGLVATP